MPCRILAAIKVADPHANAGMRSLEVLQPHRQDTGSDQWRGRQRYLLLRFCGQPADANVALSQSAIMRRTVDCSDSPADVS
jgi:hypothetical protein